MAGNPAFIFMNPTIKIATDVATGTDMVCEVTKVELTNDVNMVDTGSLCGPAQQPGKISWTLSVEGYQDYAAGSLWRFLWDNQRKQAQFEIIPKDTDLTPAGADNPTISGTIVCVPGTVGGTREEVASYSVELPLVGDPVLDDGVVAMEAEAQGAAAF
jgi:hypothetical protein